MHGNTFLNDFEDNGSVKLDMENEIIEKIE